jgi:Serine endopeptidase inhibitors
VKESSIKFSLSTLALLGLASVAAAPALADSAKISGNSHLQPTSEIQTNELKEQDLPFFARFLEGQKQEATDRKVALTGDATPLIKPKRPGETGGIITTKKYPSDAEDNSGGGIVTTQKYPSDSEDNSGGGIITTKKYPSDAEDNSGGHRPPHHRR